MGTVTAQFPSYVVSHPVAVFTTAATGLAFFALTPTPNMLSIVGLLVVLRLSAFSFVPRPGGYMKGGTQAFCISLAAGAAHLAPSMEALSTPNVALIIISAISLLVSLFAVSITFASVRIGQSLRTPWAQLTIFPALWATAWGTMSKVSPLGQLVTWCPVLGLGPYQWVRHEFGQWGVDYIAATWAVIVSEFLGDILTGAPRDETPLVDAQPSLIDDSAQPRYDSVARISRKAVSSRSSVRSRNLGILLATLLSLMLPSYFAPYLPDPLNAEDMTPFSVACALPTFRSAKDAGRLPTPRDYIKETTRLQTQANVIFWPESAVHFNNAEERTKVFAELQESMNSKKFVGVSFDEFVPAERRGETGHRRNSFLLLGKSGPPVLEYDKRNLVPIAESFSITPGQAAPEIFTLPLSPPSGVNKSDWAPGPNYTRPIPLTTSICLDFASASSFASLPSRPALILAPAKTWHIAVGFAMWEQAKARAAETGATVVWCDGGEGGISGIASGAYNEIVQVGPGSWTRHIGIHYPFDERRTFYSWGGNTTAFLIVWAIMSVGAGLELTSRLTSLRQPGTVGYIRRLISRVPGRAQIGNPSEETSLLG